MRQAIWGFALCAGLLGMGQSGTAAEPTISAPHKRAAAPAADCSETNRQTAALLLRAKESAESRYYKDAEDAIRKSFALDPRNFEARKLEVAILLGEHQYAKALEGAKELNRTVPDDVAVYGLLTEAYSELGNYKDAEISAQWMLNLRPGNRPALLNAAHLRDLFGELDGAFELFDLAYESTVPSETVERASTLTQMSHLRGEAGKFDEAEKFAREAMGVDAAYRPAQAQLASVFVEQKHYDEAIELFQSLIHSNPRPELLFGLAEALDRAGRVDAAKKAFADYYAAALAESGVADNSNRELVFYYANHAKQPAKALELARQEFEGRKDVYTLDAYAWALHVNGQEPEARKQMDAALAVGVHDPKILAHAAEIRGPVPK